MNQLKGSSKLIELYRSFQEFNEEASDGLHIILSLSEKTSFAYDDKLFNLGYGDFFLLNRPQKLFPVELKRGQLLFLVLKLEGYNKKLIYQRQLLSGNSAIDTQPSDVRMKNVLVGLLEKYYTDNLTQSNALLADYYIILDMVVSNYFDSQLLVDDGEDASEDELFFSVLNYIDQNFRQHITLNEIAKYFYQSPSTMSKFFQKRTGKKFMTYLKERRLQVAEGKVVKTDMSMIQIALDTGFPNVASFNKAFKEAYGDTPASYRKAKNLIPAVNEVLSMPEPLDALIQSQQRETSFKQTYTMGTADTIGSQLYHWNYLINLGSAQSILQYGFKEQLQAARAKANFQHGRFWGIFDDEFLSFQNGKQSKLNFRNIEKVIDLLLDNQLIPFIELGDKPFIINRNTKTRIFSESPQRAFFFEKDSWEWALEEFIKFAVNRWGKEEVSRWKFELWKTNLTVMLDNDEYMRDGRLYAQEAELYIQRFNKVSYLIKKHVPKSQVGGCGLSIDLEKKFMQPFLERWAQESITPDFVSIYVYPMNPVDGQDSVIENRISSDKEYFSKSVKQVKRLLKKVHLSHLPLIVSEWNFSISNRNYLQDTCFKAAFILKSIFEVAQLVDGMGYWLLSDLYGEFMDTHHLFHGGAGLITKDNVKKPAFYACEFLAQMAGTIIFGRPDILVTRKDENFYILMHNFKHLNQSYFLHDESDSQFETYMNIFEDTLPKEMTLQLKGLPQSKYRIRSQYVNQERGSMVNQISAIGSQAMLGKREIDYLKQVCVPSLEVSEKKTNEHCLSVEMKLLENEIRFVAIERLV